MTDTVEHRLSVLQGQVAGCTQCDLHQTRTHTVFARGNPRAHMVICGESPGEEEDKTGLPFVGRSGKLLDKILTELGLNVETDIYVCNSIKCRPPNNRKPTEEECNTCFPFLEEQLQLVNPKVIVALGNTAAQILTNTLYGMTKIRGKFLNYRHIPVMCSWHPSYLLRNNNPNSEPHQQFRSDLTLAINKSRE